VARVLPTLQWIVLATVSPLSGCPVGQPFFMLCSELGQAGYPYCGSLQAVRWPDDRDSIPIVLYIMMKDSKSLSVVNWSGTTLSVMACGGWCELSWRSLAAGTTAGPYTRIYRAFSPTQH
jgi:hypothetical protein